MIPPNVGPPKTIAFVHPSLEPKLREQFVYQAYVGPAEMAEKKFLAGNRLLLKYGDEVVGEGQISLVDRVTLQRLTQYDAILGGYESLESLQKHLLSTFLKGARKPAQVEFFKILFRWL